MRWRKMASLGLPGAVLVVIASIACSPTGGAGSNLVGGDPTLDPNGSPNSELTYIFDGIIGGADPLVHEFAIMNPTDAAVHIASVIATTPCCSRVESYPRSIPPHRAGIVKVGMRTGPVTTRRRVQFLVSTDSPTFPALVLNLGVEAYAPWEILAVEEERPKVLMGRTAVARYTVVSRSAGEDEPPIPTDVRASGALSAAFEGAASEHRRRGGIKEWRHTLAVRFPAETTAGEKEGSIQFRRRGADPAAHVVRWRVVPAITARPGGIVVTARDSVRRVIVSSADGPFRILAVDSGAPIEVDAPTSEPAVAHTLNVRFPEEPDEAVKTSAITITTDRIDQRLVTVSVLRLDRREGDR